MARSLPVTHHLNLKRDEICKIFRFINGFLINCKFRPVKYDRKLMEDTVEAVKRVTEIRKKREGSYSKIFRTMGKFNDFDISCASTSYSLPSSYWRQMKFQNHWISPIHTYNQRYFTVANGLWNGSRTHISTLYLEQIGKIKGSSAPCWFMGSWHESQSGSGTSSSRWETQRFQVFTNNNSYRNHNLSCKEAVWVWNKYNILAVVKEKLNKFKRRKLEAMGKADHSIKLGEGKTKTRAAVLIDEEEVNAPVEEEILMENWKIPKISRMKHIRLYLPVLWA